MKVKIRIPLMLTLPAFVMAQRGSEDTINAKEFNYEKVEASVNNTNDSKTRAFWYCL